MKEPLIVALAGLVILVLVVRFIRGLLVARRFRTVDQRFFPLDDEELVRLIESSSNAAKAKETLRVIVRKAQNNADPTKRAGYYCVAGDVATDKLKRPGLSVGFYLRALRTDPTCLHALEKLQDILMSQRRLRRLEWIYWEVLGRLDDNEVGSTMWLRCWQGLAAVYSESPRTVRRADAIRKTIIAVEGDTGVVAQIQETAKSS